MSALARLAPWALAGESIVGLARWRGARHRLPAGLSRDAGPVACLARRATPTRPSDHSSSSIVGHPARLGLRFGWHDQRSGRDRARTRASVDGSTGASLPSMADLSWEVDGDERALVWLSRGFTVRGAPRGMPLPWLVPVRALQRRSDGCVIVPGHQRGRARLARVVVEAKPDDLLDAIEGAPSRRDGRRVCGRRCAPRERRSASQSRLSPL